MGNIQGLLDEFASCQEGILRIIEVMMASPPSVQTELLPTLDDAMGSARYCAKEIAALLAV